MCAAPIEAQNPPGSVAEGSLTPGSIFILHCTKSQCRFLRRNIVPPPRACGLTLWQLHSP